MVHLAAVGEAIAAVGPYLVALKAAGGKVLEGAEKKLGEKVFELLSARLTGRAKTELEAAKAEPNEENLAVLKTLVESAANRDEVLAKALAELGKSAGTTLTMNQTGDGNKGVQIVGKGNSVNF
jgi:hypothetical protein